MSLLGAKKKDEVDWKEKYYQSLDRLDEQEKVYADNEKEFTKYLIKLTYAHNGQSPELDKQLKDFRNKLRDQKNPENRNRIISNIVDSILESTDKDSSSTDSSYTVCSLTDFLETIQADSQHQHAINQLKTKLDQSISTDETKTIIKQASELFNELLGKKTPERNDTKVTVSDEVCELLNRLSLPGDTGNQLEQLKQDFKLLSDTKQRLQVLDQIAYIINRLQQATVSSDSETTDSLELITQLLEWISIPENFTNELAEIKEELIPEVFNQNPSRTLQNIANFLSRINKKLQSELAEMEVYLSKVIDRLKEFEKHLSGSKTLQQESLAEVQQFNIQMKENAEKLKHDIDTCNNIDEIKITLDSHLEIIDANLDIHLKSEQERQQESQKAIESLAKRVVQIETESQQLKNAIIEERQKALKDALTGIPNRLAYEEKIEDEYSRWKRYGNNLSLALIDIDDFKKINDQYGHSAGDKVLKTVARVSDEKIRTSDFIARFGGEEFVLIFPNTKIDEAGTAAENLRKTIESCVFHYKKKAVPITVSIGIAEFQDEDDIDAVLNRADSALYSAKSAGKNRYAVETHD